MATNTIAQPDRGSLVEERTANEDTLDKIPGLSDEWLILLVLVIAGILADKEDQWSTR